MTTTLTDADLDRIADAVPVDPLGVHITTWHRRFARAVLAAQPAPAPVPLTDEQIIALNANEVFFSESPSKYPEAGHGTQYHAGAPGVIAFARAVLSAAPVPVPLTDEQIVECAEASDIRTDLWAMGSGSLVYSDYCNGIPRADFTNFARAIERAHGIAASPEKP
jgi:hypothetical protein